MMFKALKSLYERGRIHKNGLRAAVCDKLITEEEYKKITGEDFA